MCKRFRVIIRTACSDASTGGGRAPTTAAEVAAPPPGPGPPNLPRVGGLALGFLFNFIFANHYVLIFRPILSSWCFVWLLFYLLSKRIWCRNHLSMYTTHGGIHLTSLYCNKEEIQFVKYHRTACISHQIIRVMLQKIIPETAWEDGMG